MVTEYFYAPNINSLFGHFIKTYSLFKHYDLKYLIMGLNSCFFELMEISKNHRFNLTLFKTVVMAMESFQFKMPFNIY